MRNIFSILTLEQNPAYVDELEAKYNIQLPPIFKAFVQTFEFGKINPDPQHMVRHPNKELGYEGFDLTLEESIRIYFEQGQYYQKEKILPIITSGMYSGGICLGINTLNTDKIILHKDYDEFPLIASDILQFIKQLKEVHWD